MNRSWTPGFQSRPAIELALSFGKLAKRDSDASIILYRRRFYSHAVFLFQQAVEKDAKAIGLVMGMIQPTPADLMTEVSHLSLLGVLIRLPDLLEKVPTVQQAIRQELDKPQLKESGIIRIFEPILKPPLITADSVRTTIAQVKGVRSGKEWWNTLSLGPGQEGTVAIINMLKVADKKCLEADEADLVSRRMHRLILRKTGISTDRDFADYLINISGRAVNDLIPLALISMWHERETRYPPITTQDNWDPWAYTEDKGLIRLFPELHRHTRRLCKAVILGIQSSLKSLEKQNQTS